MPIVGGIVIYLSLLIILQFLNSDYWTNLIIYSAIVIVVMGALDDAFQLNVTTRLVCQIIACILIFGGGLKILDLGNYQYLPYLQLGIFGFFLSGIAVVSLTNAMNFMDGLDGLSASLSSSAIIGILSFSFIYNDFIFNPIFEIYFYILISLLIFLFFNFGIFFKRKIFLGDSGSMTLGFLISWFLIYNTRFEIDNIPPVLALWCVSLPLYDFFGVIIRRLVRRRNPFSPDRRHLHHLLIDCGFSQLISVLMIFLTSLIFLILGGFLFFFLGPDFAFIGFVFIFFIYLLITFRLSKSIIILN